MSRAVLLSSSNRRSTPSHICICTSSTELLLLWFVQGSRRAWNAGFRFCLGPTLVWCCPALRFPDSIPFLSTCGEKVKVPVAVVACREKTG